VVYSPLEQFEPVSLFPLLLGGNINISITSITFMFFFIMALLPFFFNGSLAHFNVKNLINLRVNNIQNFVLNASPTINSRDYNGHLYATKLYNFLRVRGFLENDKKEIHYKYLFKGLKKQFINPTSGYRYTFTFVHPINLLSKKKNTSLFSFFEFFKNDLPLKRFFIPTSISFIFEFLFKFILDQVKSGIVGSTKRAVQFFPMILTLFVFILVSNLLGLIPYSSTVTAYIIVTLTLSIMVNVGVTIYGFQNHGIHFFSLFLPPGVPLFLWPILIPIEIISYFIKVVSLSVRLFANMMAGHTLLAVLAGFGWTMATSSALLFIVHPLPVLVVFVLVGLELAVACIQAFVFALLTSIYISDSINLH
jgi:ATP synthase subunit 6